MMEQEWLKSFRSCSRTKTLLRRPTPVSATGSGAESSQSRHGFNFLRREPNIAEISDQITRPPKDVVLLYHPPHSRHSRLTFFRRQFQCNTNRFCHLLGVVRIDDESIVEFAG